MGQRVNEDCKEREDVCLQSREGETMKRARDKRNRITFYGVALFLAVLGFAFGNVKLAEETIEGQTVYRLENERVSLLVNPAQGGNVTSFKDKKGGNVELVHQVPVEL